MCLIVWPAREVERIPVSTAAAVAERNSPQPVDHDGATVLVLELSEISSRFRIVGVQLSIAKVADDQRIAERTEVGWREGHAPRRLEMVALNQPLQQIAARIEDINES